MCKILLVEDDEANREMLYQRLKLKGYQVLVAGDGVQAVASARSAKPDLIIMDMSLPVLDGLPTVEQLKRTPQTRAIPVIALTDHVLIWDRVKCLAAGCDEYEIKPVEVGRLMAKIDDLLANRTAT